MPIYEYRCKDCANEFEELLLGRDKEPELCPKCQSANIARKVSNTSFSLKGKGWYVTDYGGYNPGSVPSQGGAGEAGGEEGAGKAASETESDSGKSKSSNQKEDVGSKSSGDCSE